MKIQSPLTYLLILLVAGVCFLIYIRTGQYNEHFTNKYTINDINLYIFSWKRVNENAVKIYKKVAAVFPNTYFLNCDENFDASRYIPADKLIQLDDSYYFGGQFQTAIRHCPRDRVFGNIVGDVDPDAIDWKQLAASMLYGINSLNAGVVAPDAPNYPNMGAHIEGSYYEVDNTDCTIFFITPDIWSKYKHFPYKDVTHHGYGIDIFFCNSTKNKGKKTIRDSQIKVDTDKTKGYTHEAALKEMNEFLKSIKNYKE